MVRQDESAEEIAADVGPIENPRSFPHRLEENIGAADVERIAVRHRKGAFLSDCPVRVDLRALPVASQ
jgi:hypothetical protein